MIGKNIKKGLDNSGLTCYYIPVGGDEPARQNKIKYPGVAKFGIALEWGSRGRWFESSHSDQKRGNCYGFLSFLCFEQRTSGLLLRRQAHFNLPHGNAVRSTAFPTGSNPVTRTIRFRHYRCELLKVQHLFRRI